MCIRDSICAAFYTISTDGVLAGFLCISRASCWDVVFPTFSGRTDSRTHALAESHTQTDRPECSVPPAPFINSGGDIKSYQNFADGMIRICIVLLHITVLDLSCLPSVTRQMDIGLQTDRIAVLCFTWRTYHILTKTRITELFKLCSSSLFHEYRSLWCRCVCVYVYCRLVWATRVAAVSCPSYSC